MAAKKSTPASQEDSALKELFLDELKDIYWAELHLAKALPKMAKGSTSPDLKKAFEDHLVQTKNHATRLEQAFQTIGEKAEAVKCEAMNGLLKEADELQEESEEGTLVRDVALISAAQKVEHYEIASYGTIKTLALILGYDQAAELLTETLEEEKAADHLLTQIAEGHINAGAAKEKK
ncbi:MAG: ferritin-like domain-containing protein [Janthinobacterium lividum]